MERALTRSRGGVVAVNDVLERDPSRGEGAVTAWATAEESAEKGKGARRSSPSRPQQAAAVTTPRSVPAAATSAVRRPLMLDLLTGIRCRGWGHARAPGDENREDREESEKQAHAIGRRRRGRSRLEPEDRRRRACRSAPTPADSVRSAERAVRR
jgi:hypothetical protein